jgi:drug/metabolite transporter (DMT)-like permease
VRPADLARLVALAAIWGASFVFMRVLVGPLGPWWMTLLRVAIAGVVLVAWLAIAGHDAKLREHWRAYAGIGVVNSAMPFMLYGYASLSLPASYMVILNSVTPLWAALLAAVYLRERLTPAKLAGIATGIGGVAVLSGAGAIELDAGALWAVAACLAATLCYAGSSVWIKRRGGMLAPQAIAAWSQVAAGAALLPPSLAALPAGPITPVVVVNVLALALLCSAVAYLLYFRLIRDLGPTRALTVTFLMPAFGMLLGALLLGEAITLPMLAGAALVVAGTALVLRPGHGWRTRILPS